MGRPFVTTAVCCVFCFLCAAHTQCLSHHSKHHVTSLTHTGQAGGSTSVLNPSWDDSPKKQRRRRSGDSSEVEDKHENCRHRRDVSEEEMIYVRKLFEEFGEGNAMTFEGFEKFLRTIGLQRFVSPAESVQDNISPLPISNAANAKLEVNSSHIEPIPRIATEETSHTNLTEKQCVNGRELFSSFSHKHEDKLQPEALQRLCPRLLYHLTDSKMDCIMISTTSHNHSDEEMRKVNHGLVWLYATLSIFVISLCGLLGVAVIPIMQQVFYQQLLQFLVALAVGTLCGDALLHLLPHALVGEQHTHSNGSSSEHTHDLSMWKGLVAALGLVFFFFTEKCLTMIGEWRKQWQRRRKVPSRVRVMRDADNMGNSSVGEKLCKHKYSSYPYCYGEITTEMSDDHHHRNPQYEQKNSGHNHNACAPVLDTTQVTALGSLDDTHPDGLDELRPMTAVNNSVPSAPDSEQGTEKNPSEAESYTVIIREHENKHHGHSHTHGHVHSPPDTLSSVAWMVIMGDGLHNFTDGMAIGAAFAANIPGGFSTAVAVFCHELPHELGDFAVLLKAGMSAKQAVIYNLLSSILCLFGMVLGVFLGESATATGWVFSAAAGMFLYIALVDMIPELTTSHSKEGGSLCQCLLQCVGLVSGIGIMLVIATYEHDLRNVFSDK